MSAPDETVKPTWAKFAKLFEGEIAVSLINEPIEPIVRESASSIARRRWHMPEDEVAGMKGADDQ